MSMIQDHFVINVAKATGEKLFGSNLPARRHYFFAEVVDAAQARDVFNSLRAAYPYPEFDVTVRKVVCRGVSLDWS